jgi:hypothetical protein
MFSGFGHPAVGDINGDGVLDPVNVGVGRRLLVNLAMGGKRYPYDHLIGAWDAMTSTMLDGFPKINEDMTLAPTPVLANLDNLPGLDVIIGSGGYFIHAFGQQGEAQGFPHFTGGWTFASASVGDLEGDGKADVAITTREGYVLIWSTEAPYSQQGWLTFKGDIQRQGTGTYTTRSLP